MDSITHPGSGDPGDGYEAVGTTFLAACILNEADLVGTSVVALNGERVGVCVEAVQHLPDEMLSGAQILLSATDARRLAAALLNAADDLDGTVPLAFYERPAGDE